MELNNGKWQKRRRRKWEQWRIHVKDIQVSQAMVSRIRGLSLINKIWDSHGSDYTDYCPLKGSSVQFSRCLLIFQRNILPPSSG
jgi:hypothetical protein